MDEFLTVTSSLKSSTGNISSSMKTNRTLEMTNINPFTKDLEQTITAIELLEKYKALLESDNTILKDTGETMKENDEQIAQANNNAIDSQPIS